MKVKKVETKVILSLFVLAGLIGALSLAIAGDLEPSAPPAATMKTLDEVEPRIPIHQADLPLTINQSGSYYLTEDATAIGTAITVDVDNVTIDLMGYSLIGPGGGSTRGILITEQKNVEIRNGTIRQFGYGIYENNALGAQHRVVDVRAVSNVITGINLIGFGHLVKDCTASENDAHGISVWAGCTVTGNTARDNGGIGIFVTTGCTVTGNTAYNNGGTGIQASNGCTVTGNTAKDNGAYGISTINVGCTVTGNTAYNNEKTGIAAGTACTVTGNTLYLHNQSDAVDCAGISVNTGCLVKGNTLRSNKRNNIYLIGSDNAIEENLLTNSDNGIYFALTGNFYTNNRVSGSITPYNDVPGTNVDGGGNVSF